jgi:glyoxylase-like metal-dependent hydrolase (beta-lactamase superfamily II)
MQRNYLVPAALSVLVAFSGALIAQETEAPKVTTTRLADGLFMLGGAGGNSVACLGPSGVLLVDTGFNEMVEPLLAEVEALGDKPVQVVVNTHWHLDHVTGNQTLARSGVLVTAHENVRLHMSSDQNLAIIDRDVPASPPETLPSMTFEKELRLHWGDEDVSLLHLPSAHSDGDTVVRFASANVIHAGDIFFNCGYPFIDISHGGTIDGLIAAVERILELSDDSTRIVPGHGPLAKRGDLETYRGMLRHFRSAIAREVAAGKDLPAILEVPPTGELDAKWGGVYFSPPQFTELVFRTLPRKP